MHAELKKDAIRAYKERKRLMGIYAITCSATGDTWVGQTRNLDTQQNRLWFALRLGRERPARLQETWNVHGPEAFSFETVAQLDNEDTAYPDAKLNALLALWRDRLGARPI